MTDSLITRLTAGATGAGNLPKDLYRKDCADALAEIERLTKERDLALANADAVYAKLMPDVERLRAALDSVVSDFVNPHDGGEFERGEIPSLDVARDLLGHQQRTNND